MTVRSESVFRVLGPLRVGDGAVPGGQFSRFLGALLLEPGRVLAAERLARWALGTERSDDLTQLQVLAARVRRLWTNDGKSPWGTIVYYDGEGDRAEIEQKLREIASPDPTYESWKQGASFPLPIEITR